MAIEDAVFPETQQGVLRGLMDENIMPQTDGSVQQGHQQCAFFDVSVFHPNAQSYCHAMEKPLVFGMGPLFYKQMYS